MHLKDVLEKIPIWTMSGLTFFWLCFYKSGGFYFYFSCGRSDNFQTHRLLLAREVTRISSLAVATADATCVCRKHAQTHLKHWGVGSGIRNLPRTDEWLDPLLIRQ